MNKFIDISNIKDIEELEKAIRNNFLIAKNLRKEIDKIDKSRIIVQSLNNFEECKEKKSNEEIMFDESEYEYYYDSIKNIPIGTDLNILRKIIEDNLPSKQNNNYFNIILYIKYRIDEEILTYEALIDECNSTEEINILNDIKYCIEYLKIKLSFIDEINYEVQEAKVEKYNTIIFLHSPTFKNYPISDLESIDVDFYDEIIDLYESIKNRTFKGVKRFKNNDNNIYGVSEVRVNSSRIIFDRLTKDIYIILQILIKKTNKDYAYKNSISNRYSNYNKKEIMDNLNKEEFWKINDEEKDNLEKILYRRKKKI